MCGIAAIIAPYQTPLPASAQQQAGAMGQAMARRGPDDQGHLALTHAMLVHRRLSIIDLSSAGHQPMTHPNGKVTLVYNGEIYNFRALRQELMAQGHTFSSQTDTEVLLALYVQHGPQCLHKLQGMFAFVAYHHDTGQVFAARDRLGIKPLYMAQHNGLWYLASSLQAMMAAGVGSGKFNTHAATEYLLFGSIQQPRTILHSVSSLLPGQYLQISPNGQHTTTQWWQIKQPAQPWQGTEQEAIQTLHGHLQNAINLRMIADRPLGLFLSGGLDSATVLAYMAQTQLPVSTFSIGFDHQQQEVANEATQAAQLAQHFGVQHNSLTVTGAEVAQDFEAFIQSLDQPSTDGLNTFLVSKHAANHMTVALSGLGGDELFAGYTRHHLAAWKAQNVPAWQHSLGSLAGLMANLSWRHPRATTLLKARARLTRRSNRHTYTINRTQWYPAQLARHWQGPLPGPSAYFGTFAHMEQAAHSSLAHYTQLDLRTFMASQLLRDMDAVSMHHSMEVRFPLIDHELVQWAAQLPNHLKYRPQSKQRPQAEGQQSYAQSGGKYLLLKAVEHLLPKGYATASKQGFKLPLGHWLRHELAPQAKTYLQQAQSTYASLWAPGFLNQLQNQFEQQQAPTHQYYKVLVLMAWLQTHNLAPHEQ